MAESPVKINKEDIEAIECRFVLHIPSRGGLPDFHMVKEQIHLKSGAKVPNIRFLKDVKRPFWVSNQQYRGYKQKKEVESLDRLMKFETTQSEMRDVVAKALGRNSSNDQIKKLANSPYLYGSEIPSAAIIKKNYQDKNTTHITPFSVMMLDLETDMVNGTQDPIIGTAAFGKEMFLVATKDYLKGIADAENMFRSKCKQYIGDFIKDLDTYNITYVEANGTVDLIRKLFVWVHSHKPDLLAIWNMNFDIPKILDTLERYGVDPRDILCDPSVPPPLRICKYKLGLTKKRKANGQEYPIDYADQWHSLTLTASFYVIDAMCTYRLLRLAKPKEQSYSLDAILTKELGLRKLKFKEADNYVKDRWHTFMQSTYKVEYMVYALFDSMSMKLLDEKLLDLCFSLPAYAGITHFSRCNSKPKMIADALHFYVLSKGYVLNSVGEQLESIQEFDEEGEEIEGDPDVLDLKQWIVTLPPHLVIPGLPLIAESELVLTKLRAFVYDSDCVSAYPTATSILNVSKNTTKRELVSIENIPEEIFRKQNINLCSGYVNALEYGEKMFNLPSLFELPELVD